MPVIRFILTPWASRRAMILHTFLCRAFTELRACSSGGFSVHTKGRSALNICNRSEMLKVRRYPINLVGFTPAISPGSAKRIRLQVRRWRPHRLSSRSLEDLAHAVNPIIRGWMNYYGAYQRSLLVSGLRHIDHGLVKWVKWKYKKRRSDKRARRWLGQVAFYQPGLFAHWRLCASFTAE